MNIKRVLTAATAVGAFLTGAAAIPASATDLTGGADHAQCYSLLNTGFGICHVVKADGTPETDAVRIKQYLDSLPAGQAVILVSETDFITLLPFSPLPIGPAEAVVD